METERCWSGRTGTTGNRVGVLPLAGSNPALSAKYTVRPAMLLEPEEARLIEVLQYVCPRARASLSREAGMQVLSVAGSPC